MSLRFRFNAQKALQVILWLAQKKQGITFHTILKVLFYADKYHLNRYGRPIVGDDYAARQYGPVASTTYDILKGDELALEQLHCDQRPFDVRGYQVFTKVDPNLEVFSDSDLEALKWALAEFGFRNFGDLTALTHKEKAWLNAEGGWMSYEDFLEDTENKAELIEDLEDTARRLVI